MSKHNERIIGTYDHDNEGPLLFVFAGMHGNEPSGVSALEEIFRMLQKEPSTNPNFIFHGRIVGVKGNLAAFKQKKRFIVKDLNRQFTLENIHSIQQVKDDSELDSEDKELRDILELVNEEIEAYNPKKLVFLDMHTTTAFGGIFSIATDDPESQRIAVELHAPVIRKLIDGIQGTTLHYFNKENFGRETVAVTFESGQHDEELSIKRAIAAITNCLRSIGCVSADVVENKHDSILIEYSKGLPKIADLLYCHSIAPNDDFQMKEGYKNFHSVKKDEILAFDKKGEIRSKNDGRILMPLYQKQGEDGFFIIETIEEFGL
ncbi:MAG: succinylglutamate desuccinylase [Maribacter sp.]|jgi:succinylglutamate desuccinylase